jgi:hypothetical protein
MARYLSSYLEQELPGLAGFWSVLGDEPPRLTIIDYYPVINQPMSLMCRFFRKGAILFIVEGRDKN